MTCRVFYVIGFPAVAGKVLWNRVLPSFRPSVPQSGRLKFCFKFWHGGRNPYLVRDRARWVNLEIFFYSKYGENRPKMAQNVFFLKLLKNLVINFFLNLFSNGTLYYLLFLRKSHICGKHGSWYMGQNALG